MDSRAEAAVTSLAKWPAFASLRRQPSPCAGAGGEGWWEVLVTLQFVCFRFCFATPDLQAGNRITSLKSWEREWESHPPEEVYEASLCALVEFPAVEIGGVGG